MTNEFKLLHMNYGFNHNISAINNVLILNQNFLFMYNNWV